MRSTPEERAAARNGWRVRRYRLGEEPPDTLHDLTPEQRLEMMWPLALEAWSLMGKPLPDYPRSAAPVKIVRNGPGTDTA